MKPTIKRVMRSLPYIGEWRMFRVLYTQDELVRLEAEMKQMQAEYERLSTEDADVLEEFRRANPRVSSELRIHELVRFQASRLKDQIGIRMLTLRDARKHVE